jgi:tight adherence protein C
MLILAIALLSLSAFMVAYQFTGQASEKVHLPPEMLTEKAEASLALSASGYRAGKKWFGLSERFKSLEQRMPSSNIKRRLIKGGSPMGIAEFMLFKMLTLAMTPILAFIFLGSSSFPKLGLFVGSLLAGWFIPEMWLNGKIKKRQNAIRRDLPSVIDLLNLCVSGGLDFMLAVVRVVKDLKPCELTIELSEVYRQTQMGKTRRDALKNFAWRVDMPEIHSFVRTLVQADRMGTPMADALKLQAEEIRMHRFHNGEAMALKAPIKLLFPLFAFILPVVLIIVGGPIILQFTRSNPAFGF